MQLPAVVEGVDDEEPSVVGLSLDGGVVADVSFLDGLSRLSGLFTSTEQPSTGQATTATIAINSLDILAKKNNPTRLSTFRFDM